jgi:uncharacterized protein (TIGR02246 family)
MRDFIALGAAAVTLLLTGFNRIAPDNRDADAKALVRLDKRAEANQRVSRANEAQWNQDFASKDVEKLVAHYADNAVFMGPGMRASYGKDAIRRTLTEMLADPAISRNIKSSRVEFAKAGDIAYMQGSYTMTMSDPGSKQVIQDHGSYVTTYRQQRDGSWKAVADIATSEVK